jgi:prevent-host-death family protein
MATITIRKLNQDTAGVVDRLLETREPTLVTRNGRPVAALVAVDANLVEDIALATAPEFKASLERADRAVEAGETKTMDEIFGESPSAPHERLAVGGSEQPADADSLGAV